MQQTRVFFLNYIRERGISLESFYCLQITCCNWVLTGFLTGFVTLLQPATSLFRERLRSFGSAHRKSLCPDLLMTEGSQIFFLTSKKSKHGDYMATHLADRAHLNIMQDAAQAKRLSAHNQAGIISKYLPQLPWQTARASQCHFYYPCWK